MGVSDESWQDRNVYSSCTEFLEGPGDPHGLLMDPCPPLGLVRFKDERFDVVY